MSEPISSVLVIEPDLDLQASMREALRDSGYIVAAVADWGAGLRILANIQPCLVLIHVGRVAEETEAFIRLARAIPDQGALPIVVLAPRDEKVSGATGLLKLPATEQQLVALARTYCHGCEPA